MSRRALASCGRVFSFPRVSGDEPKTEMTENTEAQFSPRERG